MTYQKASWNAPIAYEDGQPLPLDEILEYQVRRNGKIFKVPATGSVVSFMPTVPFTKDDVLFVATVAKNGLISKEVPLTPDL